MYNPRDPNYRSQHNPPLLIHNFGTNIDHLLPIYNFGAIFDSASRGLYLISRHVLVSHMTVQNLC